MLRILVAGRSKFICDSIGTALKKQRDIYIVGHVSQTDELLFLLPQTDVALISANFQGNDTIKLIRDIHRQHENIKFIVVGVPDAPARIVRFVEAGAAGYILENECVDDLLTKVDRVVDGEALVSDKVASFIIKRIHKLAKSQHGKKEEQIARLSPRQREVIQLLSKGLTNKEIADRLHIEYGTVKNHVHHIFKKIDATNRHEAASIYQNVIQRTEARRATTVIAGVRETGHGATGHSAQG